MKKFNKKFLLFLPLLIIPFLLTGCNQEQKYYTLNDINGQQIGIPAGTSAFGKLVQEKCPKSPMSYFNTYADGISQIRSNKIAGFVCDEPTFKTIQFQAGGVAAIEDPLGESKYGFFFKKEHNFGVVVTDFNNFLVQHKDVVTELQNKWLNGDITTTSVDIPEGLDKYKDRTVVFGALDMNTPFSFSKNGQYPSGLDVDLIYQFSRLYHYYPVINNYPYDNIFLELEVENIDCAVGGFTITEERLQKYSATDPYYIGNIVIVVNSPEPFNLFDKIVDGFVKTFIVENRWLSFLSGIGTTLLITLVSLLAGTFIGFGFYLLGKNNKVLNKIINGLCIIFHRTPVTVLLLIFYYVFFGAVAIDPTIVSIICFTLMFSCTVCGLIKNGVKGVDPGQNEGALALGYTKTQSFLKIIFPQALKLMNKPYEGEVVSLIKGTSVVGFISVLDLTKVSDIIRSNTFEAFFPLISSAIIYFVLATLLILAVKLIYKYVLEPKNRKEETILKRIGAYDKSGKSM